MAVNAPVKDLSLVRFDAMVIAIEQCHAIDEVKEMHDQALSFERYAKQAKNFDAERKACEIRLRAERKAGQLLKKMQRGKAGRPEKIGATVAPISGEIPATVAANSEYSTAIESTGLYERTAQRWQELAAVPQETFDAVLSNHACRPSAEAIRAAAKPAKEKLIDLNGIPPDDFARATQAQGSLRSLAEFCKENDPVRIAGGFQKHEIAALRQNADCVNAWLDSFINSLGG